MTEKLKKKTENLTLVDTSVRDLTSVTSHPPTQPGNMGIVIPAAYFDILQRKTVLEFGKNKNFCLRLEKPSDCQLQHVFISGPVQTLGKEI